MIMLALEQANTRPNKIGTWQVYLVPHEKYETKYFNSYENGDVKLKKH